MKSFLPVLFLIIAIPAFAAREIVPVAGHLPGAAGTSWSTDIILNNTSGSSQTVQLIFHPASGTTLTRTLQLTSGESRLLQDAVKPEDFGAAAGTSWLGLLEVVSPGEVKVSSRTFSGDPSAGGTFGSSFDAVDPAVLPSRGVITGLLSSPRFRSNVAFTNATDRSESFRFDISDGSGAIRASSSITVGAMSTAQIALAPFISPIDDTPFSLSWTADDRGLAVGSIVDNKSGDPTGISSAAIGSNRLFFPIVASTPGNANTFWTTSVAVTSDSDSAGDLTLQFTGNDDMRVERRIALAPHGTFRTGDLFKLLDLSSGSGFLSIDASVPVFGAARVFNTTSERGTFGSSIPSQDRVVKSTSLRIHGVRRDSGFRLNVGLANEDRVAATGTIRLFDDRGNEVERQSFSLRGSSSAQFAVNRSEVEVHGGEVEVEVENGIAITAVASNIDNRSGDTNVVEVEQENERQQHAEVGFSPKTAFAGTPVTMTATLKGFSNATFTWNFGDGTATASGQPVTHTFANPGEFIVTLTATLPGGATLREVEDITVLGNGVPNPNASFNFTWTPVQPQPGQVVTFTASGGAGSVKWHFPGDIRKTGNPVMFTFGSSGQFEVEAEVERENTPTIRVERAVTVGNGSGNTNPSAGATTINITVTPSSPARGQTATFTATFDAQPVAGSVVKWKLPDASRPTGNPVSFTLTSSGMFEIEAQLEQPGKATIEKKIFLNVP